MGFYTILCKIHLTKDAFSFKIQKYSCLGEKQLAKTKNKQQNYWFDIMLYFTGLYFRMISEQPHNLTQNEVETYNSNGKFSANYNFCLLAARKAKTQKQRPFIQISL